MRQNEASSWPISVSSTDAEVVETIANAGSFGANWVLRHLLLMHPFTKSCIKLNLQAPRNDWKPMTNPKKKQNGPKESSEDDNACIIVGWIQNILVANWQVICFWIEPLAISIFKLDRLIMIWYLT